MSEHQRETAFLRHCIRYDESTERRKLDERLSQIQRDERCVWRAMWLMLLVAALAVAGLVYSAIFLMGYPLDMLGFMTRFLTKIFCALGLASLICLPVLAILEVLYRRELDRRREECRRLVMKIMETRMGHPGAPYLPEVVSQPGNTVPQNERLEPVPQMDLFGAL